jgi:hypothetical protein
MVAVAIDDALEQRLLAGARALGRQAAVGKLGPDQHPHAVGDVVVARVGRLDVAAEAVEAELLGLAKLIFEELDGRDGTDRIGVVVLVERAAQVERLPVEMECAVARLERAEAERLADLVVETAVAKTDLQRIEVGLVRRPEAG